MRAAWKCPTPVPFRGLSISCGLLLVACHAGRPEAPPDPSLPAGTVLRDVEVVEFSDGRKLWDLKASHVHIAPGTVAASVVETEARFWSHKRPVSRLKAPEAMFESTSGTLVLKGKVLGESLERPLRVTAGEVVCRPGDGTMTALGGVSLERNRDHLVAPTMKADLTLRRVTLGSPVHARLVLRFPG